LSNTRYRRDGELVDSTGAGNGRGGHRRDSTDVDAFFHNESPRASKTPEQSVGLNTLPFRTSGFSQLVAEGSRWPEVLSLWVGALGDHVARPTLLPHRAWSRGLSKPEWLEA